MDETDVAYIAGVVDSIGLLRVKTKQDDRNKIGYTATPKLQIHRDGDDEIVIGMLDDYCAERSIKSSIEKAGNSLKLEVRGAENLRLFFNPLAPYTIQKHDRLVIMMNDVLPCFEEKGPRWTKEKFIEMMEAVDKLYEREPKMNSRKYDADFFKQKWR